MNYKCLRRALHLLYQDIIKSKHISMILCCNMFTCSMTIRQAGNTQDPKIKPSTHHHTMYLDECSSLPWRQEVGLTCSAKKTSGNSIHSWKCQSSTRNQRRCRNESSLSTKSNISVDIKTKTNYLHTAETFLRSYQLLSWSRTSLTSIELGGSLLCSQQPVTGSCPESDHPY